MNKTAAIYARVSSDQQKEQNTIASQTTALLEYAQFHQYTIPPEWIFEDAGYSGSVLVRPGLERLRDLIAEGAIETVLVYGPDRLSRNYAYQVLLLEEFERHGTAVIFLKAPVADTPEQKLLVQFQGMIAEYERAQIAERCRRGKRHRAKAGVINVLSRAPYGYRYVKKTEAAQAYFEVLESEAEVVRSIFSLYTVEGRAIRAIAQALNHEAIPTRFKKSRWIHATVWGILKNEPAPSSQRRTRPRRQKGLTVGRTPAKRKRPREEWIPIAVPALVSQATFELAQDRLELNQRLSPRNTLEASVVQGLVVCAQCGYAWGRMSCPSSSGGRLRYYRCSGLDRPQGKVCQARPVRLEQLDELVWGQVWQLLNQPELIRSEIERRLQEHQQSRPVEQRREQVTKEIVRLEQQTNKLLDAYQEGLMEMGELRQRMPELKKRQQTLKKELESLALQAVEHGRLVEMNLSMERFMEQLRNSGQRLDVEQKQKIVRLLVRQVDVGPDSVTIHHSIRLSPHLDGQKAPDYRLCMSRRHGSGSPGRGGENWIVDCGLWMMAEG